MNSIFKYINSLCAHDIYISLPNGQLSSFHHSITIVLSIFFILIIRLTTTTSTTINWNHVNLNWRENKHLFRKESEEGIQVEHPLSFHHQERRIPPPPPPPLSPSIFRNGISSSFSEPFPWHNFAWLTKSKSYYYYIYIEGKFIICQLINHRKFRLWQDIVIDQNGMIPVPHASWSWYSKEERRTEFSAFHDAYCANKFCKCSLNFFLSSGKWLKI